MDDPVALAAAAAAAAAGPVRPEVDANEERLRKQAERLGLRLLPADETRREASRLLLGGWRMLAEACPVSEFPLFEKGGKLWSVRLGMPAGRAQDGAGALPGPPSHVADAAPEASSKAQADVGADADADAQGEAASERIGEKLLAGWTLLQDACPVTRACPLMRDPRSGRLWSPALGKYVDEVPGFEGLGGGASAPAAPRPSDASRPSDADARKLVSRRIQDRLLQGWIMMEQECPITHTCPLMRDPDSGNLYSAALDRFVDPGELSDAAARPSRSMSTTTAASVTTLPPTSARASPASSIATSTAAPSAAALAPPASARAEFRDRLDEAEPESGDDAVRHVSSLLKKKMRLWGDALDAADDVREARDLVGLLRESAALMRELRGL